MSLPMTDGEICESYRTALEPNKQIRILAELNCTSKDRIAEILKAGGYKVDGRALKAKQEPKKPAEKPAGKETKKSAPEKTPEKTLEKPEEKAPEKTAAAELAMLIEALKGTGARLTIEVTL